MSDQPSTPAPATHHLPVRVLYADDMKELRDLITIVLGKEGHRVETVPDGAAALARVQENPDVCDLLITDHHMPGLNGLELVTQVRKLPFRGKIVVFSSELSQEVSACYEALAVDRVLQKPVLPSVLRQLVRRLFTART